MDPAVPELDAALCAILAAADTGDPELVLTTVTSVATFTTPPQLAGVTAVAGALVWGHVHPNPPNLGVLSHTVALEVQNTWGQGEPPVEEVYAAAAALAGDSTQIEQLGYSQRIVALLAILWYHTRGDAAGAREVIASQAAAAISEMSSVDLLTDNPSGGTLSFGDAPPSNGLNPS